jgi:hypothetical protein
MPGICWFSNLEVTKSLLPLDSGVRTS